MSDQESQGRLLGEFPVDGGRVTIYRRRNFVTMFISMRGEARALHIGVPIAAQAGKLLIDASETTPYDEEVQT